MQVEIGNSGYRISTDPHNYILEEKRIAGVKAKVPGKVFWDQVGYYSSLEGAIKGCLSYGIENNDLEGVQEIKNYLDSLGSEILKSLQKHFGAVVK